MAITEFLTARYDEREALFAVADFDAAASARGAGWGRRCCPLCDTYLWEGTEPATEAEFILWLVAAIGSSGDDEPTCTTAEHCEQQQFWHEQNRMDRDR